MGGTSGGTIQTKTLFDLTAGNYILSFDQGKNGTNAESMDISVGSVFTTLFSSPQGSNPLVTRTFNFTVGTATTGRIVFAQWGGASQGIVVDNVRLVRVVTAVPEASSLALLLPMVGLVALARTRRNKK
jgi:hypothetical protein